MKIEIWLDKDINLYTLVVEDGNVYECLSKEEVVEVLKQEIEGNAD